MDNNIIIDLNLKINEINKRLIIIEEKLKITKSIKTDIYDYSNLNLKEQIYY